MLSFYRIGLVHKYPHLFEKKKKLFFWLQTNFPFCLNRCPRRNISHFVWNETYVDVEMSLINQSNLLPHFFSKKNVCWRNMSRQALKRIAQTQTSSHKKKKTNFLKEKKNKKLHISYKFKKKAETVQWRSFSCAR